ncbi:MAG: 30S ribosomal protein S5 [Alphaproteobacteria bacterium MarineAlpha6_Bin6]|nr:30S ribosomal protein S5 [Pelagibacteraceae bacterium]PPR31721.1 MAG: 30S ribosomal protein S5 [Alphaproteobacteria bacterium MarineAlpha6_Bin6]PPR32680.1 MAG: 30S ribosomal protein S5 [Alphaproteobacteria bacterium MarineAlpha6_Bin5]|tara:strand:- start:402 stop:953 length:552 start_codon:yes stop_codon:yes gene_type:complete
MEVDIKKHQRHNNDNLIEKVVYVNRVSKVVKGGRRFGTAALVVVGNGKGKAGFGNGKAKEFPESIKKATDKAKRSMRYFPLKKNRTFFYDVQGTHGSGKVLLRAAPPGTGIIAGGPIRSVFEALGVQDVVAKSIGTTNPHNMVRATFDALDQLDDIKKIAERRGKKVTDLYFKKKKDEQKDSK